MGSVYFYNQFALSAVLYSEGDVWKNKPTRTGIIIFSVVVPAIASVGIVGNSLSFLIFRRKELSASVYTYLAVLAATDLFASIYLVIFGLSNGILVENRWSTYDMIIGFPIGGFISCISVLTTVAITVDRVVYLWKPFRLCKPRFCHPSVAKRIVILSVCISALANIPYCFIFTVTSEDGGIETTEFFSSTYYRIHNWIRLTVFGLIPLIILILGNSFLISAYRTAVRYTKSCHVDESKYKKHLASMKFTFTLVLMVIFFILSSIPVQLLSRNTVVSILFDGDEEKIGSDALEVARQIFTVTTAISISLNFFVYYALCPSFSKVLKKMLYERKKRRKSLQVNVFLINKMDGIGSSTQKNIMKIVANAADMAPCIEYGCSEKDVGRTKTYPSESESSTKSLE